MTASADTVILSAVPITFSVGIGPLKDVPVIPAPATIAVKSPTVGAAQVGTPEASVKTSVSDPLASFARVVAPLRLKAGVASDAPSATDTPP